MIIFRDRRYFFAIDTIWIWAAHGKCVSGNCVSKRNISWRMEYASMKKRIMKQNRKIINGKLKIKIINGIHILLLLNKKIVKNNKKNKSKNIIKI